MGSCCDCCEEVSWKVEVMCSGFSSTRSPNINHKHPMVVLEGSTQHHCSSEGTPNAEPLISPCKSHGLPAAHCLDHLTKACAALTDPFTAEALLSDAILTTLASNV
ncbi:hypothetical protein V8B97DRAFT_2025779 [Scleroderma yunnanense]